jgi:hypothetical protein
MNRDPQDEPHRPSEDSHDNVSAGPWLLSRRRARQQARWLHRRRLAGDQRLAWHVQDVLVGCGLSQADYSIAAGRVFHIPKVVSVVDEYPVGLTIHMLPGQMPDDYAAHARRIAYNLDVAEVRVIPLGPHLIRMELFPKPDWARASVNGSQDWPPQYPRS